MNATGLRSSGRVVMVLAAALFACAKPPPLPPDPDGDPEGARLLPLNAAELDELACAVGDCADWFEVEIPGEGYVRVDVKPEATGSANTPALEVRFADELGRAIGRPGDEPTAQDGALLRVEKASYRVAVSTSQVNGARVPYQIEVHFQPLAARPLAPRPAPPPRKKPSPQPPRVVPPPPVSLRTVS